MHVDGLDALINEALVVSRGPASPRRQLYGCYMTLLGRAQALRAALAQAPWWARRTMARVLAPYVEEVRRDHAELRRRVASLSTD